MGLGELLQKGAEYRELSCDRGRVGTTKIISMRCILSRGYSSAVKGRKTYSFIIARHGGFSLVDGGGSTVDVVALHVTHHDNSNAKIERL